MASPAPAASIAGLSPEALTTVDFPPREGRVLTTYAALARFWYRLLRRWSPWRNDLRVWVDLTRESRRVPPMRYVLVLEARVAGERIDFPSTLQTLRNEKSGQRQAAHGFVASDDFFRILAVPREDLPRLAVVGTPLGPRAATASLPVVVCSFADEATGVLVFPPRS